MFCYRTALPVALLLAASLAGCGDSPEEASTETEPARVTEDAAFPVTVDHELGATTVDVEPKRVVVVGLTEQDALLALGVTPVGVTEWYGEQPFATWPWATEALGEAEPEVLSQADGLQLERIAELDPDLIIGTNAGLTPETYDQLTDIAPTIAHPAGEEGYFSPWDQQTLMIGAAVGRAEEAQKLIDGIRAQFAAAAADHPEFAGQQAIFLQNAFYDGEAIAYQEGLSTQFLTDLGFEIPDELDSFVTDAEGSQAFIPLEQLSVLDAGDVLIWATENDRDRAALETEPLYNQLDAVQDGRLVFTDGLTAGAIYFTSVLSLPYVLDTLVPALASAVAGEGPATAAGGGQ